MSIGLDPKRRACLAIAARVEQAKAAGVKTLTPELVLQWIWKAAEQSMPELICEPGAMARFHSMCTKAELTWLVEQYECAGLVEWQRSAELALSRQLQTQGLSP